MTEVYKGLGLSSLDALEENAKETLEIIAESRREIKEKAIQKFISSTEDTKDVDKILGGNLDTVIRRFGKASNGIFWSRLHTIQHIFGEVPVHEFLIDSGLFSKQFMFYGVEEDFKFDEENPVENFVEVVDGVKKYFDPNLGEEVTEDHFNEFLFFILMPTSKYLLLYEQFLEILHDTTN